MDKLISNNNSEIIVDQNSTELNKLRLAFEQTPGAIFILDHEFRFEYVNPGFTELSGYSKQELIGKTVAELFYHKDLPESRNEIVKSLLNGEKWQGELLTFNKNGFTYLANTIAAPCKDESGKIDGYIIIQQDITERTEMVKALRESEAKYKTLVENSHDGIMIVRDNRILFANDTICEMTGYCLTDKSVDIIHPDDRHKMITIGERRRNGDLSTIHESIRMLAKNGEIRECETTSTMILFEGDWAAFYTVHDVTQRNRFEEELKNSEEKYRQLFVAESDAIFMIDAQTGQILDANPATSSIYGYSHEELLKMKNTDISAEPEKTAEATKNNETRVNFRLHKRKDGTVFPVELSAGFTSFKNRKIQIVTSRDITERIKTQEELAKSEQKYRELAEMLPQAVYELDAGGIPTYLNKAGLKAFGIDKKIAGSKAFDFFIDNDAQRMKSVLKLESENLTVDDGNTVSQPSEPSEFTAKRTDGSTFPVLIYGTSIVENNKVIGSRGLIVDISERKAMENALRESEEKYKTLIENSQDGIFAIVEDKMLFANSTFCKMVGYTPEELYNKSAVSLVHPDDQARGLAISELRKQGNRSTINDIFRFVAKDGSIKEGDVFSSVMELNGQIVSYITVHDLTETRKIQEELQQSEEKYRNLIENATDGIVIAQDGILKFVNMAMCDMLQYTVEEMLNHPYYQYVENPGKDLMEDSQIDLLAEADFKKIFRSRLIRKDKMAITVELNARTSIFNEKPAAFIVIRDITERIKIENELQIAKFELEKLNTQLEKRVKESSRRLTEARTQLINLQKENLQSQYDVLKQQVNPHFLFNSLNVLTSLIKLEPDLAEKFSEQLSKVYRYVLENKDNELVDLNTELNFLDAYIFLLNIRFVGKLNVNLTIPEEKRNDKIIPLAMQLLIENAIKHNVMSKSNPLGIDIFIDSNDCLNIINNLQERPSQIVSTGVGLKNILNRYKLLDLPVPTFEKTKNYFIAKIKLVKNQTTNPYN